MNYFLITNNNIKILKIFLIFNIYNIFSYIIKLFHIRYTQVLFMGSVPRINCLLAIVVFYFRGIYKYTSYLPIKSKGVPPEFLINS
jgi:hypothetical protein